jgi:hypothetical protein
MQQNRRDGRPLERLLVRWTLRRYPLEVKPDVGVLGRGPMVRFEFRLLHFLLGAPWQELLADYDPR